MKTKADEFLKALPISMPFIHEFDGGFVASAFIMMTEEARHIFECKSYLPLVRQGQIRPLFKTAPILSTWKDDLLTGIPTDQDADEWDKPFGINQARRPHIVYAGIDRTLRTNSWWKIDESGWILMVNGEHYMLANIPPEESWVKFDTSELFKFTRQIRKAVTQ